LIRLAAFLGLLGLAASTAIIVWTGFGAITEALSVAGWGILWTSLFHLVPMITCVLGWHALMPGKKKPGHLFMLYILWLRTSVNNLMPVARIGGEVVAVRVMIKHGISKATAIASTVVEITLSVIAVFLFDALGIGMFAHHVDGRHVTIQLILGLVISAPVIAALVIVQRAGFFGLLTKLFNLMLRDKWTKFAGDAAKLDRAVLTMYRRRVSVGYCTVWQFISWCSGAGEIWLALHFLGHELPPSQAFMIEALIQATASVAFAVPGALGVQEAGFVFFGRMLGLTPEIAAALAVIRRCRDLLIFVPGLITWQIQEGRWLLGRNARRRQKA
jgi:putative membrane protein